MASNQQLRHQQNGVSADETAHSLISAIKYDTIAISYQQSQATFNTLRSFFKDKHGSPSIIVTNTHYSEGYRINKYVADEVLFQIAERTGIKLTRYKNQGQTILQFFGLYQYDSQSLEATNRISLFKASQIELQSIFGTPSLHSMDICFDTFKSFPIIDFEILKELYKSEIESRKNSITINEARKKLVIYNKTFKNKLDITIPITRFEQTVRYSVKGTKDYINDWIDVETIGDYYKYDFIKELFELERALSVAMDMKPHVPYEIFE